MDKKQLLMSLYILLAFVPDTAHLLSLVDNWPAKHSSVLHVLAVTAPDSMFHGFVYIYSIALSTLQRAFVHGNTELIKFRLT